jgi:arylsulfatase
MNNLAKAAIAGAAVTGSFIPVSITEGVVTGIAPERHGRVMPDHPNIVLIMTDQHNADYLHCLGKTYLKTPNLDALAAVSAVFRSAYSASPVSGPSRAAIFTGCYPLQNGVHTNWIPLKKGPVLLTDRLAAEGYYNAMIGKLHLTPVDSSHGFTFRKICDSPYDVYDKREVIYNDYLPWAAGCMGISRDDLVSRAGECERLKITDPGFWLGKSWADDKCQITTWTGNEAVSFINGYKEDKPFFLHISFFGPHHPYTTAEPWISMYDPEEVTLPPTLGKVQPGAQKGFRADWPESLWREIIARYSGSISAIDYQVGRIIKALKEKGLWDNTLVVFTSDHGDHMGDFSQLGKGTMLESSVRVPFLIKPPGETMKEKQFPQVINLIDLYSTFLDYAGARPVSNTASESIRPILSGSGEWKNQTYSSLCSQDGLNGQVMFIKDNLKCVGFLKDGKLSTELYDLSRKNPDSENLADSPEYKPVVNEMKIAEEKWLRSLLPIFQ